VREEQSRASYSVRTELACEYGREGVVFVRAAGVDGDGGCLVDDEDGAEGGVT